MTARAKDLGNESMANQLNDAAFEIAVDAAYERAGQNDDLVSIVQGAVAAYVSKLSETQAIVPREATDAMLDAGMMAAYSYSSDGLPKIAMIKTYGAMIAEAEPK